MTRFKKLNLNHILSFTIIILFVFLIKQTYVTFYKSKSVLIDIEKVKPPEFETPFVSETKPFSYYEDIFRDRDLFKISLTKNTKIIKPEYRLADFKLLGVILFQDKRQVLIKDMRSNYTFKCQVGDVIGEFTVKEVLLNKIILKIDDEFFELKL